MVKARRQARGPICGRYGAFRSTDALRDRENEHTLVLWPCAPRTFMDSTSSESTRRGRFPSRRRNAPDDTRDAAVAPPLEETAPAERSSSSDHDGADSDESTSLLSTQPPAAGLRPAGCRGAAAA